MKCSLGCYVHVSCGSPLPQSQVRLDEGDCDWTHVPIRQCPVKKNNCSASVTGSTAGMLLVVLLHGLSQ